jgi:hypothetical protein
VNGEGRSPRATNVSNFYDAAYSSRDPGQWPNVLREAWGLNQESTEPLPLAPDNIESRGSRASQYNS